MRLVGVLLVGALLVAGCGSDDERLPPYVVTAIDYHFHDAHPSMPIELDRALQFSNQGSNVHNVTFEDLSFTRNVRPGERFTIDPISEVLDEPGRYPFFCKFHVDRGMAGTIVITAG